MRIEKMMENNGLTWYDVNVVIGGDAFTDAIMGRDKAHAMTRAWNNWDNADAIELR